MTHAKIPKRKGARQGRRAPDSAGHGFEVREAPFREGWRKGPAIHPVDTETWDPKAWAEAVREAFEDAVEKEVEKRGKKA